MISIANLCYTNRADQAFFPLRRRYPELRDQALAARRRKGPNDDLSHTNVITSRIRGGECKQVLKDWLSAAEYAKDIMVI